MRKFGYGANDDGYWCYKNMVLQFEDVVDCLRCFYGEQYKFVFYFDHSSGHDCLRPDGLNVNSLNSKYHGGKQNSLMRNTIIQDQTYLGPHQPSLRVGDTQYMCFRDCDNGPFYLTPDQQIEKKYDRVSNESVRKRYTKAELIRTISDRTGNNRIRGTLQEIHNLAQLNNIPIHYETRKTKEGWVSKPKGMLQILYERGYIDTQNKTNEEIMSYYTVNGRKDINGDVIEASSLKHLIANLPDFKAEITLLQYRATQLDVRIECSPKYHPEIAGEGIEFAWGYSKNAYRREPLKDKKSKEKFRTLVDKVTGIVDKDICRKFGKRIRQYMLAYLGIEFAREGRIQVDNNGSMVELQLPTISCGLVEKLVKIHQEPKKCH